MPTTTTPRVEDVAQAAATVQRTQALKKALEAGELMAYVTPQKRSGFLDESVLERFQAAVLDSQLTPVNGDAAGQTKHVLLMTPEDAVTLAQKAQVWGEARQLRALEQQRLGNEEPLRRLMAERNELLGRVGQFERMVDSQQYRQSTGLHVSGVVWVGAFVVGGAPAVLALAGLKAVVAIHRRVDTSKKIHAGLEAIELSQQKLMENAEQGAAIKAQTKRMEIAEARAGFELQELLNDSAVNLEVDATTPFDVAARKHLEAQELSGRQNLIDALGPEQGQKVFENPALALDVGRSF